MKQSTYAFKLAGAAALAGSTQAYGQIVLITPPSNITGYAPTKPFPVLTENYDVLTGVTSTGTAAAGDDFTFAYWNGVYTYSDSSTLTYFSTAAANLKLGSAFASTFQGSFLYANAISEGTAIGSDTMLFLQPTHPSVLTTPLTYLAYGFNGTATSIVPLNTPTYVGFQFLDSQDNLIHDGWFELEGVTYTDPSNPGGLLFLGGAYNSVADSAPGGAGDILAGEVPEAGTISSLVLGAAALGGVGLMRRRRVGLATVQN